MKKYILLSAFFTCFIFAGYSQSLQFNWGFNLGKTAVNTYPLCSHTLTDGDMLMLIGMYVTSGSNINDSMNINPLGTPKYVKFSSTVARYNPNGTLVWSISWPTPFNQSGITINNLRGAPDNSFWVSGTISGTADADPDTGVYLLSSKGNTDIFVAHVSADGKLISAFTIGSSNPDVYETIAHGKIDAQGNVYLFGNVVNDGVDFDPGTGETRLWGFGSDATGNFMAKYSAQGNLIYVKPITSDFICQNMSVSGIGEVVLLGRSRISSKPIDMDPGNGEKILNGRQVIAAYDESGNLKWGYDYTSFELTAMNSDATGNIYVAGMMLNNTGAADIDFSFNTRQIQASAGGTFVATYSKDGNMLWHGQMGIAQNSYITGTNNAPLYFAGLHISGDYVYAQFNFKGSGVDVDPGATQYLISSLRPDEHSTGIMRYNRHTGQFSKAFSIGVQSYVSGLYNPWPIFDAASQSNFYLITLFNTGINQITQVDADPHPQNTYWITRQGNVTALLAHYSFDYIHTEVPSIAHQAVQVHPNPFHQSFTIEGFDGDVNIKLYNTIGQLVYEQEHVYEKVYVDVKPGMYVLYLTHVATQTTLTKKLVRN